MEAPDNNQNPEKKPKPKAKIGWGIAILVVLGIIAASHGSTPQSNNQPVNFQSTSQSSQDTSTPPSTPSDSTSSDSSSSSSTQTQDTTTPSSPTPQPTCTNGTYVNSDGNTVCSPETSSTVPAGATAQCVDGTYSFSQHRSGTCSHHGGVAQWL